MILYLSLNVDILIVFLMLLLASSKKTVEKMYKVCKSVLDDLQASYIQLLEKQFLWS